jgi:hypothetical protein
VRSKGCVERAGVCGSPLPSVACSAVAPWSVIFLHERGACLSGCFLASQRCRNGRGVSLFFKFKTKFSCGLESARLGLCLCLPGFFPPVLTARCLRERGGARGPIRDKKNFVSVLIHIRAWSLSASPLAGSPSVICRRSVGLAQRLLFVYPLRGVPVVVNEFHTFD